jgi:hypothetical protein
MRSEGDRCDEASDSSSEDGEWQGGDGMVSTSDEEWEGGDGVVSGTSDEEWEDGTDVSDNEEGESGRVAEATDTSDEEEIRNTRGNIPLEWYNELSHFGYDIEGKRISKPASLDADEVSTSYRTWSPHMSKHASAHSNTLSQGQFRQLSGTLSDQINTSSYAGNE